MDKLAQNSFEGPNSVLEGQVSKAKAMPRSQKPQGSKKGASPSWLEGGVCLNKNILLEEKLKDPACVDALCQIRQARDQKEIKFFHLD